MKTFFALSLLFATAAHAQYKTVTQFNGRLIHVAVNYQPATRASSSLQFTANDRTRGAGHADFQEACVVTGSLALGTASIEVVVLGSDQKELGRQTVRNVPVDSGISYVDTKNVDCHGIGPVAGSAGAQLATVSFKDIFGGKGSVLQLSISASVSGVSISGSPEAGFVAHASTDALKDNVRVDGSYAFYAPTLQQQGSFEVGKLGGVELGSNGSHFQTNECRTGRH